jgi:hypothetical protein
MKTFLRTNSLYTSNLSDFLIISMLLFVCKCSVHTICEYVYLIYASVTYFTCINLVLHSLFPLYRIGSDAVLFLRSTTYVYDTAYTTQSVICINSLQCQNRSVLKVVLFINLIRTDVASNKMYVKFYFCEISGSHSGGVEDHRRLAPSIFVFMYKIYTCVYIYIYICTYTGELGYCVMKGTECFCRYKWVLLQPRSIMLRLTARNLIGTTEHLTL